MRVWTDGGVHVIVGEEGVELHRPKQPPVIGAKWKRPKSGFPGRDVLAVVGKDPIRAWVGTGRDVRVISLGGAAVDALREGRRVDAHVLDAVGLADGRVLACIATPASPRARLVVLDGEAPDVASAQDLPLPAATKIAWPGGIWAKDAVPWPEDDADEDEDPPAIDALAVASAPRDGGALYDEVLCSANEHGITVTSVYSGIVAVLPPDASRVDFAVRVPTQVGETEIFAARTPSGVAVVICVEGRHAAILHVAPDGKVIAHRDKAGRDLCWGMGPPVVQGERVVVFEAGQTGADRLHELSLGDLVIAKTVEVGQRPGGRLSAHGAPGGEMLVLGLGGAACVVKRGGRGRVSCEVLERPPPPAPEPRATVPSAPELVKGAPWLIPAKGDGGVRAWSMAEGQPLSIEIPFANQGGMSRGVSVEVSGQALAAGLVKPLKARVGEMEAPLTVKGGAARAEFPAVPLPAAVVTALEGKKGALPVALSVLVAGVELVGAKAGSSLLTVRIAPLGAAAGRGSLMQGKSVTVVSP